MENFKANIKFELLIPYLTRKYCRNLLFLISLKHFFTSLMKMLLFCFYNYKIKIKINVCKHTIKAIHLVEFVYCCFQHART